MTQHDLASERDDELYGRGVDFAERFGDRVVVVFRDIIIHEELQNKSVLGLQHLDSNSEAVFIIGQVNELVHVLSRMFDGIEPKFAIPLRVPLIWHLLVQYLGVCVVLFERLAEWPVSHCTIEHEFFLKTFELVKS